MPPFEFRAVGRFGLGRRFPGLMALGLFLVLPLRASGLDDLRAALNRLQGQGTLRGTYEVNAWSRGGKGKDTEESTGTATAWVEEDATGLQIRWDRALLKRAEAEVKAPKGAKKTDSPTLGIDAASALKISGAMNHAPKLGKLLATGQLKQERADTYQGQPAHLLEVQLESPEPEDGKKAKVNTYMAQIWVGSDGLPLGATLTREMKASVLLISMEMTGTESLVFGSVANRLVVLRREEGQFVKTLGVEVQQRTISTFTPK